MTRMEHMKKMLAEHDQEIKKIDEQIKMAKGYRRKDLQRQRRKMIVERSKFMRHISEVKKHG